MTEIPEELLNGDYDFGFTAADEDELNALVQLDDQTTPDEIKEMQDKLDMLVHWGLLVLDNFHPQIEDHKRGRNQS